MVEPRAIIRPFQPSDKKQTLFAIGKAIMEELTVANRRVYLNPGVLAAWVALSCIFIQVVGSWPNPSYGWKGYLSPIPAFAFTAIPILSLVDWINRPYFEKRAHIALRRQPEMLDIHAYYSRPKSSGFWIFEYHETVMGLIAIDASDEAASGRSKKTASSIATIRHFYVDERYRGADVQSDLLAHAVQHAFCSDNRVQLIRATDSPLTMYTRQALRKAGFQLEPTTEKVGVFGWKVGTSVLSREQWGK